jgi:beta-lactamase regulating signal transducer with metallopeptidase domain
MSSASFQVMDALAKPVSWALIHTFWQGGLIALGLFATLVLLRRKSAAVRYAVSCAALIALFVLAVGTAFVLIVDASKPLPTDVSKTAALDDTTPRLVSADGTEIGEPLAAVPEGLFSGSVPTSLLPWISLLWFSGVLSLSLYHVMGWRRTRQLARVDTREVDPLCQRRFLRLCARLGLARRVRLLESAVARAPFVVGWLRPTVLVPVSALTGLSTDQLELILVHELAHIRRYDVLVNYIQTVVETLLFHNPAAWWISRQVRIEREHCCDDLATEVCGSRLMYARALVNLEELRRTEPSFSMAADGASIMYRIRRLAGKPVKRSYQPVIGLMNIFSLVMLLGAGMIILDGQTTRSASAAPIVPEPAQYNPDRDDIQGRWTIEPRRDGRIQLMMRRGSDSWFGSTMEPDVFQGLAVGENRTFQLKRDAGTFFFEGDVKATDGSYSGSGRWYFQASSSYIEALQQLGFDTPSKEKSLELAIHDVSLDFVHGLDREGYRGFPLSKLIELHIHDVTPEYIHALAELGYKDLSLSKLVEMQIHDVEPDYIRALQELGYRDLSASKLVEMQIHDVTPEFIRGLAELGYKDLSASKLIQWQIHDVDPEYLRELKKLGYEDLSASKLVEMRIHDVEPEFISALNELGYSDLSPSKLVEMQIHDVDPDYIRDLAELGLEDMSPSKLIEMRIHDVEPDFVRELAELGYKDLSPNQLVSMKIHDVTPRFIRGLQERGFEDLTPNRLIELKIHGTWRDSDR